MVTGISGVLDRGGVTSRPEPGNVREEIALHWVTVALNQANHGDDGGPGGSSLMIRQFGFEVKLLGPTHWVGPSGVARLKVPLSRRRWSFRPRCAR